MDLFLFHSVNIKPSGQALELNWACIMLPQAHGTVNMVARVMLFMLDYASVKIPYGYIELVL